MAWPFCLQLFLLEGERQAVGDVDLFLHQVNTHHPFGDGMFNLEAGVHLQEIDIRGHHSR